MENTKPKHSFLEEKDAYRYAFSVAWPAVIESFFVAFAGLLDSLMVSSMGSAAVAATGLTTQPKFISLSLFLSTNVAVSALVARRRGEKDRDGANRVLSLALLFVLFAGIVVSSVCVLGARSILQWAGAEADTLPYATTYFRIISGGMIFNILSLTINAAQRGSGNTRVAMRTNITGSLVNIFGNYLLIGGHWGFPAMGIRGAALATVLGTVVSMCMSLASVLKADSFVSLPYLWSRRLWPQLSTAVSILRLAGSVLIEQLFMRVGFMSTALMVARLGTDCFAAHNVGINLLSLSFAFGDGMQAASVALIGRSLGQRDGEKAKRYGFICQRFGFCISLCIALLYFTTGKYLYSLFFTEPHIIRYGVQILRVLGVIVMAQISSTVFMGSLRGAGDVIYTTLVSTLSTTLVRTFFGWFFCFVLNLGLIGLWLGILCDQLCRLVCSSVRFISGRWIHLKI